MPPQARPRIKRHEAERLGLGRVDDFPNINAHALVDHLQLIHERDVDRAEDVFGQLDGFGGGGGGNQNHLADDVAIKSLRQRLAAWVVGPHHLGNGFGFIVGVAGVFAFRRKRQKEILAAAQPAAF